MKTPPPFILHWTFLIPVAGFLTPSLIMVCLDVFVAGTAPQNALAVILSSQFAAGRNLFLVGLFAAIPFAVLATVLVRIFRDRPAAQLVWITLGGLIGILAVMVPAYVDILYPLYGSGRIRSTAAIGFLFVPFYCIGSLAVGLIIGWLIASLPFVKRAGNDASRRSRA